MSEHTYIEDFRAFSSRYIPLIDGEIASFYARKELVAESDYMKSMYDDIREYCIRDGKRIRPLILLTGYLGYARLCTREKEIVKIASVIEMMHSFLLIQDDIIDKAHMRRGDKSLHIIADEKYGEYTRNKTTGVDVAIVLCDIIMANSLEILSGVPLKGRIKDDFMALFARTYERTAWGQILDSLHSMPRKIVPEDNIPLAISTMKTAYYTVCYPLLMGYTLSGRKNESEKVFIDDFALPLGLAFQLRDDIIGSFGTVKDTGKPNDSDLMEGKLTLLVQYTFECMKQKERKALISLLTKQKKTKADIKAIRTSITSSGALEMTRQRHMTFIDQSVAALERLSIKQKQKDILFGIIQSIAEV